eukprot:1917709-Ditylum_brightwellii.AAC.1
MDERNHPGSALYGQHRSIHIKSAEVGAMYLKLLFATAYETGNSAGIFIPNRYHLTHGIESYKQLLHRQNAYLKDIG